MNHQTQSALTVLASSILFGAAGFWLMPNQAKGALVGAVAGAATAAGYVQQDKRLRQLAYDQQKASSEYRANVNRMKAAISQSRIAVEGIASTTREHKVKIDKIGGTLQPNSDQKGSNLREIKSLQTRLIKLESKINAVLTSVGTDTAAHRLEESLKVLELNVSSTSIAQSEISSTNGLTADCSVLLDQEDSWKGEAAQKVIQWFE
ncbi:MAG: hypothetical protein F6J97_07650, partial [Leptolyngbya sp. SIO4C1]|nr:hypothetical protein [Leptolyngbya sp. SIO4C1]